jgi:hypothetical protein
MVKPKRKPGELWRFSVTDGTWPGQGQTLYTTMSDAVEALANNCVGTMESDDIYLVIASFQRTGAEEVVYVMVMSHGRSRFVWTRFVTFEEWMCRL